MADLTGVNAFIRKTDDSITVSITNSDNSDFAVGTHTFRHTVRTKYPKTVQADDTDAIITKDMTSVVSGAGTKTLSVTISYSETDLNIDPGIYVYDIKWTDPSNVTTSIQNGNWELKPDATRRNPS